MIQRVTYNHLRPIWYHSETSEVHYSPNQFLGWDFYAASYSKTALSTLVICANVIKVLPLIDKNLNQENYKMGLIGEARCLLDFRLEFLKNSNVSTETFPTGKVQK